MARDGPRVSIRGNIDEESSSRRSRRNQRRSRRSSRRYRNGDEESGLRPAVQHRTRVEQYSSTAQTVSGIATFAGGITLSTQLLIQCPGSRLQALLALASQLFLATPLVLLGVAAVLHGRAGTDPVDWNHPSRAFIVAQFLIAGIMLISSFLLLGVAIYVADVNHQDIGRWGLVMIALIMLIIMSAVFKSNSTNRFWSSFVAMVNPSKKQIAPDISRTAWNNDNERREEAFFYPVNYLRVFLATFIPQVVVVACLVVFGARTAIKAQVQFGCENPNTAVASRSLLAS